MSRQQTAEEELQRSQILRSLSAYSPTVVSTIWAGLDIESSDIDIICQYENKSQFTSDLHNACSQFEEFVFIDNSEPSEYVVARFSLGQNQIEIYACPLPVTEQLGYIHYQVMKRLVAVGGEWLQEMIRDLKREGLKTEPAIAQLLHLAGDPYKAVASLQHHSDQQLTELVESIKHV